VILCMLLLLRYCPLRLPCFLLLILTCLLYFCFRFLLVALLLIFHLLLVCLDCLLLPCHLVPLVRSFLRRSCLLPLCLLELCPWSHLGRLLLRRHCHLRLPCFLLVRLSCLLHPCLRRNSDRKS